MWNRVVEAFVDLRVWIASMFAVFGVMLTVYGLWFVTDGDLAKGGGINLNLWTGVGMLGVALAFIVWFVVAPSGVSPSNGDNNPGETAENRPGE